MGVLSAGGEPAPRRRRFLLGAFGDPGHAFPMIALGRSLLRRGHEVSLQTWARWREHVEAEGMRFLAAPEYRVFPTGSEPLDFYEAVVQATRDTLPAVQELEPEVVVADILTLAPALAAELAGVPLATLIPHVYPDAGDGFPVYSIGARMPRGRLGRKLWNVAQMAVAKGLERGRQELNGTRVQLGLPPLEHFHGGISRELALVATLPQLEYPRSWPSWAHVIGPLMWEPPASEVPIPPGSDPLVLVAPSTAHDPELRLVRAALEGLAGLPVRVLATYNGRLPRRPLRVPDNATVVEWLSYSRTMPHCEVVVCHAGHGTLVRALTNGVPVLACPSVGDMSENAARLDWAGAGVRIPQRLLGPRSVRVGVERILADRSIADRAREMAGWAAAHDGGRAAAELLEAIPSPAPSASRTSTVT